MAQMTGSQAVVRSLAREGVEAVFALPGAQIMGLFDALYDQPDMRVITARHEQTTTFMADGYARVKGNREWRSLFQDPACRTLRPV
jgi:acetolactate synthase-1/2/3 large subunit